MMSAELSAFVDRIEQLEDEKTELSDVIKSVYAEAKDKGYNVKALRQAVKFHRLAPEDRLGAIATLETLDSYLSALGILGTTELGQAAFARQRAALEKQGRKLMDDMDKTTVSVSVGDKSSGEMPLRTFTKLADAAKTPAGRAAVGAALAAVKNADDQPPAGQ